MHLRSTGPKRIEKIKGIKKEKQKLYHAPLEFYLSFLLVKRSVDKNVCNYLGKFPNVLYWFPGKLKRILRPDIMYKIVFNYVGGNPVQRAVGGAALPAAAGQHCAPLRRGQPGSRSGRGVLVRRRYR